MLRRVSKVPPAPHAKGLTSLYNKDRSNMIIVARQDSRVLVGHS